MIRRGWLFAVIVLVVVNTIVLTGVLRNRVGEPDAVIVLTERELPMAYIPEENSGLSLRLEWERAPGPDWLDASKLEELGFDCTEPVDAASEEFHYAKQLPREAFAVLEYEGEAWDGWLSQRANDLLEIAAKVESGETLAEELDAARDLFEREKDSRSRLFTVDAGTDAKSLRRRYSDRDRFIVAPAVVRIHVARDWNRDERQAPRLSGWLQLLVDDIHVDRRHRGPLDSLSRSGDRGDEPRYEVTVAFGRRHEPWIVGLESTE